MTYPWEKKLPPTNSVFVFLVGGWGVPVSSVLGCHGLTSERPNPKEQKTGYRVPFELTKLALTVLPGCLFGTGSKRRVTRLRSLVPQTEEAPAYFLLC